MDTVHPRTKDCGVISDHVLIGNHMNLIPIQPGNPGVQDLFNISSGTLKGVHINLTPIQNG